MGEKKSKVIKFLMMSLACVFLFTGCIRANTTITVKDNGKVDLSILYAMKDMEEYGFDKDYFSDDKLQGLRDQGCEVEIYDEDGFQGVVLTKKDIPVEELGNSIGITQSKLSIDVGILKFNKQGDNFVFDWKILGKEQIDQISAIKNYLALNGGYMKVTVNLPVKATNSNATDVTNDGKTLEWDLLNLGPDQSIHIEYTQTNIWPIVWIFGVCAVVFIGVIILVVLLIMRKNDMEQQVMNDNSNQSDGERGL